MTEVAFHFNAPDKVAYACRFARKVLRSDARLIIAGPAHVLAALDQQMWSMAPQDFVAHCTDAADEDLRLASPVLLTSDVQGAPHHEVLLNLGDAVPEGFERFERLIEVVSLDEADRQRARDRWKHYAARGYAIERKDLVLKES